MDANDSRDNNGRSVSRRRFVEAAGASGIAVGLSGCLYGGSGGGGGGGSGSGGASGTVQWGFDPTQVQDNGEAIVQLFYDNGLSQDIDLQLLPGNQDTGQRQQKYNQLLNAGQSSPDMFLMDSGWAIPFIAREQLLDLTKALPQNIIERVNNKYFEASVETARASQGDGNLHGVPLFPDFPTMHYRKDLAKQAGYKPDQENWATTPMTWKRFSKIAADVTQQANLEMGFTFQFDVYEGLSCCDFNEFMTSWGGAYFGGRENLFGPIGERPVTVDKKPVVDSLRMIRSFIHGPENDPEALQGYEEISPTNVLSWTEETSRSPFANGRAFAMRNWPYAIPLTISNADWATPETYGVMPLPYKVGDEAQGVGGSTAALGGWHMTVNPNTANEEAALEVIEVATKDEVALGLWEISAWLPPQPELFEAEAATSVKPTGQYLDALKFAGQTAMPRPVTVAWPDESGQIAQEANAAAAQDKTPQQAMNSLAQMITRIENEIAEGI
jgi:ABC-type glycerol-3-phosphate transport system substrate-binding protein